MRFRANENFHPDAIDELRTRGHVIIWIRQESPDISDEEVLEHARTDDRILVTFDKDFGELAFNSDLPKSCGIILFRISKPSSSFIARLAVTAIESRNDWIGNFAVVEEYRIRMRPL